MNNQSGAPLIRTQLEQHPLPIIHDAGSGVIYTGYAPLGSRLTDAVWMITRTTTLAGVTIVEYADGDLKFDNVWSDRASLTYAR